jgi:hypothetical protein
MPLDRATLPAPRSSLPLPELWPGATQMFLAATLLFSLLMHFQTADSEKSARRRPTSVLWLLFDSPRYLPSSQSGQPCLFAFYWFPAELLFCGPALLSVHPSSIVHKTVTPLGM